MIPAIIIAFAALVGLCVFAYCQDQKAYRAASVKEAKPVTVPRLPSPPKSKQSLRRWTFDRLMASKYASWRNPLPRKDRRAAARLEAKAALEGQGSAK